MSTQAARNVLPDRKSWSGFIGVDEGLDLLFRWEPKGDRRLWQRALPEKCRTLQLRENGTGFGVTERGFFEFDANTGQILRQAEPETAGVIAAAPIGEGGAFLAGINIGGLSGVCFVEYDEQLEVVRKVSFPGDYVRGACPTPEGSILFTNDGRVLEGDWSGEILRQFSAPGFKHAWKAQRLAGGDTIISAGYGAYAIRFDKEGKEQQRWSVDAAATHIRPFFFGDYHLDADGTLSVCNWLGHGTGLGGTGCALLQFDAKGQLTKAWQDAERTSSVQAFVFV